MNLPPLGLELESHCWEISSFIIIIIYYYYLYLMLVQRSKLTNKNQLPSKSNIRVTH